MSGTGLYDSLQIASNFMEQAEKLAGSNEYKAAITALEKAQSYAFNNEALLENIQLRRDTMRHAQRHYIKQLEDEAAKLFNQEPFDSQKAREVLQLLLQQDGANELAQSLWQELPGREAAERERRMIAEFEQELESIWKQAQQLEEIGAGSRALEAYERAVVEAAKKAGDAPAVIPFQRLKLAAVEKRDRAKDKWEGIPTLIFTRKGLELIERYESLKRAGELESEFFDENGEFIGRLPIDECLERAEHLANRFAEEKVQEYLEEARLLLVESPGAAYEKIQEAFEAVQLSESAKQLLEQELKENIQPAIARREQALAYMQAASSKENPLEAWRALDNVEQLDPFTPGLDNARHSLAVTLEHQLTRLLDTGQQFQELEDFETAQARFQEALDIGQIVAPYNEELNDLRQKAQQALEQCHQLRQASEQFGRRLAEIATLSETEPERAKAQLEQLAGQGLSEQITTKIERLRVQIEFRLGIDRQFQTLEQKMLAAADPLELISIEEGARQAQRDHPNDARFSRLVDRIVARRAFLKGAGLCQDPEQYAEALELLKQVVDKQGDDAAAAQTLLNKISTTEQQEADIAIAIEEAMLALEKDDARSAFLILQPHRYAASRQTARVRELIGKATSLWRQDIESQLEALVAAGDFILPKVEFLLHELERTQAPTIDEWRVRALAPAYAVTAKDLQEFDRWDEAELLWDEAFRLSPKEPAIVEGRRNAHKHRALIRAQTTFDPAEKEHILEDLNRTHNNDPIIKRYLAAFYYSQNRYAEARIALSQVRFLLENGRATVSEKELEIIGHMELRVQEAERIEKRKTAIGGQISEKATIVQLNSARLAYQALAETAPDYADRLERWWNNVTEGAVKALKNEVSDLADMAGTAWPRAKLLCKILVLQHDPQTQEQAQRMLKLAYDQLPPDYDMVVGNPEGVGYGSAEVALTNHIAKAKNLYERIEEMNRLEHIMTNLGIDIGEPDLKLNDALYKLELTLEKLHYSQEKRKEIKQQISQSMETGHWAAVEDTLAELKLKAWSQHRGLKDLPAEVEQAKRKRADLENTVEQLKEAVAQEQFNVVQEKLAHLLQEDPHDKAHLQRALAVIDPYTGETVAGPPEIGNLNDEKLAIANQLQLWQAQGQPSINWSLVRSKIIKLANHGEFKAGLELAQAALGQNNEHPLLAGGVWPFESLRNHLGDFPVTPNQLNSQYAQNLFDETTQKAQILMKQINECAALIDELQQKEQIFKRILQELRPLMQRVNERKDFLSSLFSSSEAQEIRQKILDLVDQGRQICPTHPSLANFDEAELFKK
jgi:tetratricopeptide (TPR) repeat protein